MESSLNHTLQDCSQKHKCKYVYKKGPNKGKICGAKIFFGNRRLCHKHSKAILSMYKSDIKNKRVIECSICYEAVNNVHNEKLRCGHIIHFDCICKSAAHLSKISGYSLTYLCLCFNNLYQIASPFLKCPVCNLTIHPRIIKPYWDDVYIPSLFKSAHTQAFSMSLKIIRTSHPSYFYKWLQHIKDIIIKTKNKIPPSFIVFRPIFEIFQSTISLFFPTSATTPTTHSILHNILILNYTMKILDYIHLLSINGPLQLRQQLKLN
jgi:hypothetical protein